jgi:phosphatidylglycerophosphatase A
VRKLFLTFFYTGLSPYAPGTVGTLAAAAVGYAILHFLHMSTLVLLTIAITIIALREINIYEEQIGIHDSKEIVIDEVAGIWLAFSLSSATVTQVILSVVFFRIFDIWKPSIIGAAEKKLKGSTAVMTDDLLAGLFAGICSAGVWQLVS